MKLQFLKTMIQSRRVGWIMVIANACIGCSIPAQHEEKLSAAKITFNFPLVSTAGELLNQADSFTVFYYKNVIVMRNTVNNSSSRLHFDKKGDFLGQDSITQNKPVFSYFIYRRDSAMGMRYKSLIAGTGKPFPVDSFLIKYAFDKTGLYNDIYKDAAVTSLVSAKHDKVDRLVPKTKPDESYPDTVYLYYQKNSLFDAIDFSLSPTLDKEKGRKLTMSRFIFNPVLPTKSSPFLPARTIWFEIEKTNALQDSVLINFLQKQNR